jgi:hypothetical protein
MKFRIPSFVPEGLLLFAVVFGPLAFGAVEPWSKAILEIDFFLLFAACALRGGGNFDQPVYKTLLPAVVALILLGCVQLLNPRSPIGPATLLPSTVSPYATRQTLILWSSYAALLWSAPQVLATREAQRRFAWTLFGVGAFIAVEGIIQLGQGNTAYYGLRHVRQGLPFGPYVNRDHAASFLVMSAFTGGGLFLSRWLGLRGRETIGAKSDLAASQLLMLFALGVVLAGVFFAKSRGAFNSFFLSLWMMSLIGTTFIKHGSYRWSARAMLGLAVPAYGLFLALHPAYIGDVISSPDRSVALRLAMYRGSLRLLCDLPIWGAGIGSTVSVFPPYRGPIFQGVSAVVDHVHSDWLEVFLQVGLIGALALCGGIVAFGHAILRSWRRDPSRARRWLIAGGLASFAAFLVHEAVDFSFHIPANAATFLAVAAYLSALTAAEVPKAPTRARAWGLPAAAAAALLILAAVRPAGAWWVLSGSEEAPAARRAALCARALAWDDDPEIRYEAADALMRETPSDPSLTRRAFALSRQAMAAAPLDYRYMNLNAGILVQMGRFDDANALSTRARLAGG